MSTEVWTIQKILNWTRDYLTKSGSPSGRLDAELLLGEVLKLRRLDLILRFDQPLQAEELATYKALIKRRSKGEPVAYILGRREFYGLDLAVRPGVLVPRPETESLVDEVVKFLTSDAAPQGAVLDLCTGSGCIALAVAHTLKDKALKGKGIERDVIATDLSPEALVIAIENRDALDLAVDLRQGDLFAAVPGLQFAAIASNPPYVRTETVAWLEPDVRDFEPRLALDGGVDGLDLLRRIARQSKDFLVPGGLVAVELGSREQAQAMSEACLQGGLSDPKILPVMGGPTSLVLARRPH
ncbi:MAG: peptide chain release factor N(5)-glutamine methyltransferase [Myxococcota bacterium]